MLVALIVRTPTVVDTTQARPTEVNDDHMRDPMSTPDSTNGAHTGSGAAGTEAAKPRARTRARFGISLMFFTNGVLFAMLLARYPEVKNALGLSNTAFGSAVIAFPLGAILAAGLAGPLVRRFGTAVVMSLGTVLVAAFLVVAGTSGTVWLFALALLAAGFSDAITDAAQNVQGVLVEQWIGRSIINSLHAVWSLGATTGGLVGTWCAAHGVSLTTMLAIDGVVWATAAVVAGVLARTPSDTVVPDEETSTGGRGGLRGAWRLLAPLVALAICGTLMEEVANSWSALYMNDVIHTGAGLAGLGFTAMLGAQFVGRLLGDPMTDRWGRASVARTGAIVIVAGAATELAATSTWAALLGFALMGFGCATLVPAAYAAAARLPGLPHGTGVAVMSWLMRLGFLATSPVIGFIADAATLRVAMIVPLAAGLTATVITHRLVRRAET